MPSVLDELRFTELNLNLTQFVDRFRSEFPVILITRTGIDPADDPLHCISAEEVSRIDCLNVGPTSIYALMVLRCRRAFQSSLPLHDCLAGVLH